MQTPLKDQTNVKKVSFHSSTPKQRRSKPLECNFDKISPMSFTTSNSAMMHQVSFDLNNNNISRKLISSENKLDGQNGVKLLRKTLLGNNVYDFGNESSEAPVLEFSFINKALFKAKGSAKNSSVKRSGKKSEQKVGNKELSVACQLFTSKSSSKKQRITPTSSQVGSSFQFHVTKSASRKRLFDPNSHDVEAAFDDCSDIDSMEF